MAKIISAGKIRRKAVKSAAKGVKKITSKKKKGSRRLYTEAESKELRSLRGKLKRVKAKREQIIATSKWDNLTLQDMRPKLGDDTARKLFYMGFFDENNKDDYENRDFAEWYLDRAEDVADMREEWSLSDVELALDKGYAELEGIFDEYNFLMNLDSKYSGELASKSVFARLNDDEFQRNGEELRKLDERIKKIEERAQTRKAERILKETLRKKYGGDIAKMMVDMNAKYEKGKGLTKGERAAWNIMKNMAAKGVIKQMRPWLSTLDPDKAATIKQSVFSAITQNPIEGLKTGVKVSATNAIVKKYGNQMSGLAGALVDTAMGSGSGRKIVTGLVDYFMVTKGLTSAQMDDKAKELVDEGESSVIKEGIKKFGVELVFDVAKDIIRTGGNVYAAAPMILKDLIVDSTKHGVATVKEENKHRKEENKIKNELAEAEKYAKEHPLTEQEFNQKFFDE